MAGYIRSVFSQNQIYQIEQSPILDVENNLEIFQK